MHIAFFNRSYYPDTTATGQLLTDLCEDLVREYGCRVSVVAGPPLVPVAGAERLRVNARRREDHTRRRDSPRARHALRQTPLRRPRDELRDVFPVRHAGPACASIARTSSWR